ncbi:MAG TPA: 5'/3'-nucleotidase SurE [Caulobacteraceae bacterium]|nr:5'/3'-nucleotidase SurE [Caulobacteraceae bacterium]
MRVLLTNDDGIQAEGLAALERIAGRLSDDVWIAAPEHEQSGASRALTLSQPLRVRRLDARRFAISGTPTDCVMLALEELLKDNRPDLVLSGVNRGHNTAEDVTMSGTVAGAIQGMALGVPAMALSQALAVFHDDEVAHYATAEAFAPAIIDTLLAAGWPRDVIININFPNRPPDAVDAVEVTRQGFRDIHNMKAERRTDLRGRDYYWMGFSQRRPDVAQGTDLAAVLAGRISVTPLHIDLTHMPTVHALQAVLGGVPPRLEARA